MACDKEYHFPLEVSLSVTEFSCLISAFYVYGWKLTNVAAVFNGKTPSKAEQRDKGHPVLKIKDVDESGAFKGEFASFVDPEFAEKFSSKKIKIDDTLVLNAAHNSDYVGSKQYRAESSVVGSLPTGEWLIARADEEQLHPRFLNYWFRSPQARFQIKSLVKGIHLYPKDVARLKIPLPSLEEQKRITSILDKADAIRRKRQQAIQLADEFLRAVFLDMFGDPVTNPKGFKKGPITELADVITGFAFKSNGYISDAPDGVRLCRGANTLPGYFDWSETVYWPENKLDKLEGYLIKSGDIILAMDRPWISKGLKVCVFPENERETYLVQRVARLRPRQPFLTDYIYSCIRSKAFERHCCPTETTVPHISPVELKNFEVPLPSDEALEVYHLVVSKTRRSLQRMVRGHEAAEEIFSALSQKAFS